MNIQFFTQQSPWFTLLCLLIGAGYAFALYQKKPVWRRTVNYTLAGCRFLLVSALCFLLLSPFIKQNQHTVEKPTVVFAVDNSQSVNLSGDSLQLKQLMNELARMSEQLEGKGVQTTVQTFGDHPASAANAAQLFSNLSFNSQATNLSQLLNTVRNNYEGRNLAGVVLVSDGIYNQGVSPAYLTYPFPIYTVGVGDTVPKQDINLKTVYSNKVAYLGNQFPIVAEVHSTGFTNRNITVLLKKNGKVLERKNVALKQNQAVNEVNFYTSSASKGMQHYTVEAEVQTGEFTTQNNKRDTYVDIIDGKEKILLIALAPHPDIKAIKSVIEKNENYEFVLQIAGAPIEGKSAKDEGTGSGKYDLVIAHQIPDNYNVGNNLLKKYTDQGTPIWYILGGQSNTGQLNTLNHSVFVSARNGQLDQVTPVFNNAFSLFKFEGDQAGLLQKLPPVTVPFGDYRVAPGSEVILYQRVGNLVTSKPLLVVSTQKERKSAVMLGEGLWEWRLEEYALTQKQEVVDELVLKLVQYLSSKEDKRKLRVYPVNEEFFDFEKVVFEAEAYNDIYEKIYDQKIKLDITDEAGKVRTYSFTTSESNSRFEISGLPHGVYRYKASASLLNKPQTTEGEFTVKDLQLEALNTTADHNLLRQVAQQSRGQFFLPHQAGALQQLFTTNKPPDVIQSNEELLEMINLKWIFFLLLALATAEWGLRKYNGEY